MTEQSMVHTSDEDILAAISHLFGFLVALIVWVFQKDKSRFVRFQAVQAMAFDVLVSILMALVVGCLVIGIVAVLGLGIGDIAIHGSQNNPTVEPVRTLVALLAGTPFLAVCLISLIAGAIFIARLVATIQTLQGNNYHYPWLGDWVEKILEPKSTIST